MPTYPTAPDHSCRPNQTIDLIDITRQNKRQASGESDPENLTTAGFRNPVHLDSIALETNQVIRPKSGQVLTWNGGRDWQRDLYTSCGNVAQNDIIVFKGLLEKENLHWEDKIKLLTYIIGTNILTKFHEDLTIIVASRMLTMRMLTMDNI
ncbi:hypothetical protein DPMN_091694 [Dreissena polymorpha]|uniref:Uncharacterized protein n=1 Tax=Dreissena polymorpha TaxID=45954 RepID=A0A9D4L0M2_DREPO|nr:hypothetical protein DPMN_091694 [Dreissena polymorpha]